MPIKFNHHTEQTQQSRPNADLRSEFVGLYEKSETNACLCKKNGLKALKGME